LIEAPTTEETLVKLFYYLVEQFDADRFASFTGVYQFHLSEGANLHWYLKSNKDGGQPLRPC